MKKIKGVHYPKRRVKLDINKMSFGIPEPERKNLYDLVIENFKVAQRNTFLHRVVYVGQHFYDTYSVADSIIQVFEKTVQAANEGPCMEKVTGFLLYYQRYFVHMIEGDEDAVCKQIEYFLAEVEAHHKFGTVKLLICLTHIHKRITVDWNYYFGCPPKLLENVDIECSFEEAGMQYYLCLRKMCTFLTHFLAGVGGVPGGTDTDKESEDLVTSVQEKSMSAKGNPSILSYDNLQSSFAGGYRDPYSSQLPEEEIFAFIINYPYSIHLKEYYDLYGHIPQRIIYKDRVWPVPSDLIIYDVFSKPFDTVTDLPKPAQEKQVKKSQLELFETPPGSEDQLDEAVIT